MKFTSNLKSQTGVVIVTVKMLLTWQKTKHLQYSFKIQPELPWYIDLSLEKYKNNKKNLCKFNFVLLGCVLPFKAQFPCLYKVLFPL